MSWPSDTETHSALGVQKADAGAHLFYGVLLAIAVFIVLRLAFAITGFGDANQLSAGLTLLIVGAVLMRRRRRQQRQMENAARQQAETESLKEQEIALKVEQARRDGKFDRFGDQE